MENVNVPARPNRFITEWLISPECRALVFLTGELYEALYREQVAKRTGELAASTHVSTGVETDRWVGTMAIGVGGAPYGVSEEFGAGIHAGSTHLHYQPAAHDLDTILDLMSVL